MLLGAAAARAEGAQHRRLVDPPGLVAIVAGGLAGWVVTTRVLDADFRLALPNAVAIVVLGALASLAAGLGFAVRPLAERPARVLRARE